MKRFFISILLWGMCSAVCAQDPAYPLPAGSLQNIIAAEYFVDTDPGVGAATVIPVTAATNISNLAASIGTTGLSNGFHRLFVRSKNQQGVWSITRMLDFLYDFNPAYSTLPALTNVVAAEYFIDTDPGVGMGAAIPITPGTDLPNIPVVINVSGLTNGYHRLFIRTRNAAGSWSLANTRDFLYDLSFAYPSSPGAVQNIVAAEYFINTDPGPGNGTAITLIAGTDLADIPVVINTSGLSEATTNNLFIRTKNAAGKWSIANRRTFVVTIANDPPYPVAAAALSNIVQAEYFINTDPGAGTGTLIPVSSATDLTDLPVAINTSSLSSATTNNLFIRTKNADGKWSISNRRSFVVTIANDPPYPAGAPAAQNITAAEYFINTDPGAGNGNPITLTPNTDISDLAVSVNTSSLSPATTNELFIRTKNNEGHWSLRAIKSFMVNITGDPAYAAAPAAVQNIVAAEYFIDTDPGSGNGTPISLSAATNISSLTFAANTTGLSNGLHRLFLRTKSIDGHWSIRNSAAFYTDLISLSADSILYGNVPINTTSYKNLIVTNNSAVAQTITLASVAAPFGTDFSTAFAIQPGQKDTIVVSFSPTSTGSFTSGLQLQTSAGNYSVGLRGVGITQVPSWAISPAAGHNYGSIAVNGSGNFSFTIQNTGNIPVALSNVSSTDAAFIPTFTTGTVIPVNGNILLPVSFSPTSVNHFTSQLKIESSTPAVSFVTTQLEGAGFNPGAAPVLQFVSTAPYNATTGVNPVAGNVGDYTYKVLYKSVNNRAPLPGFPRLSIDLNGNQTFTDLNEGTFVMTKETAGTDFITGVVYSYTYTHSANTGNAGYRFSATDDNGNMATTISTNYNTGPVVTNEQLDLRIFANDISFSQNNPAPGNNFTVFAKVTNSTALPATNVPVKFYRDTILIGSDIIPYVNPFSSASISRTLNFAAQGFYPIKVWIDSSNTLNDLNPLNNYAIRPVIVGSPVLPGRIEVTTVPSLQQCPQVKVLITGKAIYRDFGSDGPVAGAEVTINTGTQVIITTTNSNGDFSYLLTALTCGSTLVYNAQVTDFTFTSALHTNAIAVPCPGPAACVPAPSMGGAIASASTAPCANIVGGTGAVSIKLKYRERNLANFWNAWDEITKDTLKIFQDGVLIQTLGSADYSHGPGNEVTVPINVPLNSTAPTVISATLTYTYVEYLQIPSSLYHGNPQPMSHSGSVTINAIPNLPDLTIQNFAQTSFTSFRFDNVNIKCVNAGAHTVKIYDSIPGGNFTLISTRSISPLSAGSGTGITYSDAGLTSGVHFIKVKTDADGSVGETDENNNEFIFSIFVAPSELSISKISATPTALNNGSSTSFTAIIKNTGRTAGSFQVRFRAGAIQIGSLKTVAGIAENTTISVTSDAYTVTNNSEDCPVVIEAWADIANTVVEADNNNNDLQIQLGTDLAPYQLPGEVGSSSNPAVVRVFTNNQFFPAVRNIGHRDARKVTVRFTLNNNWIGSDTVNYVKAGELYASHASFTRSFTTAGDYIVKVLTDTANLICENAENNNEGEFHIRVVESKPDLEVLSQYISPSSLNPNIGQGITLVGTVKNMGGNVTTPTVLRFLVDDVQLGADVPINALLPGRDTTVAATAGYSSIMPGVKIMKIAADPLNTMVEEREDNNIATRTMIVGDAPDMARASVGAISFNPSGFVAGDSVIVNFTLKNQGVRDGNAWVKFMIKDTTLNTILALDSIPVALAINETKTVSRRMLFPQNEGYLLTEIYNSDPPESDFLNNHDTLRFTSVAKMKQSITINGNLDMKMGAPAQLPGWIGGKIMLGDYNLNVNGFILNYDSAHFMITNGTGKLRIVNASPENIFPVGTSDSSRNFVRLNNAGVPDNYSVRVAPYVLQNGNNGDTIQFAYVDRTWFIEEDVAGGSNSTAEFFWNAVHELPNFSRPISRVAHYTSQWDLGAVGAAVLNSNGQYSKTQSGFTSFSPFSVTSATGLVPLQFLSFSAVDRVSKVELEWKTQHELNTQSFIVERSNNGIHFTSIGEVPAFNTSGTHRYTFNDPGPLSGTIYYRIRQVDIDQSVTYSNIIAISRQPGENKFQLYPNPVVDILTVGMVPAVEKRTLQLLDVKGALLQTIVVPAGTSIFKIDLTKYPSGIYNIRILAGKTFFTHRLMKQ
ncbi:MAG: T9SS type A sorting domain-containing protein [Chitinophagaceae bacterium]|nr:MAG: T9SS type A sorting domain-containing protein [Chitinophagaceae bacterium]